MKERDECSLTNDYETQLVFLRGKKSSGKASAVFVLKTSLSVL